MSEVSPRVAVVGGGWAGCAAAVELTQRGAQVTLYEAARTLGGRARAVDINGRRLDNGQHILLGAYGESLRLMREVGIAPESALLRLPLQMRYPAGPEGMDFVAPRLPAPLHLAIALLRARGLDRADRLALARFSTTARWMGWRLYNDCSVDELLQRFEQTERLIRLMWRPLCIAALNTPPERASAQVFLSVLRDSLGARRSASDMLVPRLDLSELFPARAAAWLCERGGRVEHGAAVDTLQRHEGGWLLRGERYDAVVLAVQPAAAAALIDDLAPSPLPAFEWEAITTVYLQYENGLRLPHPLLALLDDPETGRFGQFVFDRGQLDADRAGLLAVVISASGAALQLGRNALAASAATQLAEAFAMPQLAQPEWNAVISEKRATFACTPGLARPGNDIGIPGLALAGDYTASEYPATLESAVRSGVAAARILL
ncbi:hydroxysqualene dehydroxylase HpnE [Noviherbaspirillum pedocola]|uniref:FAD-dependent oxidoreductase n=1 Tax=Noviherbaspirillum pedocola TaxID=2801341 RepID=A0A934SUP5_9BURK|nr:hydroxysqualene dehydroxylase HpnE [Noviherbaspirillum pedocola]MBK4735785.1 FAD-dependent oxidoreductase [Noviherbaspirillum pedocola]